MNKSLPHIVQYQGSKRKLAPQILQYMPEKFERLIEPFSGMAAVSIAAASENRAETYLINDLNQPLVGMLQELIEHPERLVNDYSRVWSRQFAYGENHVQHFYEVREEFNCGMQNPANMLYLLARCVKGSIRYGKNGNFNQSPDKRRHGTNPRLLEKNAYRISALLMGKTRFYALDYREILDMANPGDIIYMDPPYQGVTDVRDHRYLAGISFDAFTEALEILNHRNMKFLISYDGKCGEKTYGKDLPESLKCKKIFLHAGISSQATLLGKRAVTFESLYISEALSEHFYVQSKPFSLLEAMI